MGNHFAGKFRGRRFAYLFLYLYLFGRFLERGFVIKGVGFALTKLSHFAYVSHENDIIWSHRIFKNRGRGGGFK